MYKCPGIRSGEKLLHMYRGSNPQPRIPISYVVAGGGTQNFWGPNGTGKPALYPNGNRHFSDPDGDGQRRPCKLPEITSPTTLLMLGENHDRTHPEFWSGWTTRTDNTNHWYVNAHGNTGNWALVDGHVEKARPREFKWTSTEPRLRFDIKGLPPGNAGGFNGTMDQAQNHLDAQQAFVGP